MIKRIYYNLKLLFIPFEDNQFRPRFLDSKILSYYVVFLLILKLAIIPFVFYLPRTAFFADLTKMSLIELANTSRQYLGLSPLSENQSLNEAAHQKANDMIQKGYFAHYSPEGITPWYWLGKSGYDYRMAGENLAIGFIESGQVHTAWMNSPTHKQNILNPRYQEIGIAVLKGSFQGKETALVVQFFGTPKTIIEKLPVEIVEEPKLVAIEQTPDILIEGETIEVEDEVIEEVIDEEEVEKQPEEIKKTPVFLLFYFMTGDYYDLLQALIYGSLILIILSLFFVVFCDIFIYRKFEIQHKDILYRAIGYSFLLIMLFLLDKITIVELINPQNILI